MIQYSLINDHLNNFSMDDFNPKTTPTAEQAPLGADAKVNPKQYQYWWKHASVIGIMIYVASNFCLEIYFSVHHCARFAHNPNHSSEKSVLSICKYIQGTCKDGKSEGLFNLPSRKMIVDCYIDAGFCGFNIVEDYQDPFYTKSRIGFVITFSDCPIMWVSKLQG